MKFGLFSNRIRPEALDSVYERCRQTLKGLSDIVRALVVRAAGGWKPSGYMLVVSHLKVADATVTFL